MRIWSKNIKVLSKILRRKEWRWWWRGMEIWGNIVLWKRVIWDFIIIYVYVMVIYVIGWWFGGDFMVMIGSIIWGIFLNVIMFNIIVVMWKN